MKSKIKEKSAKIPSPFGATVHKTERTAVAILMHWMREIIGKKSLDLGMPDVETSGADRKMPDTVIYESGRSKNVLCVIEAKPPYYDVFNYEELKKPAWEKANERKAKYFATTNFKRLIWFNAEKVNSLKPEEEQIIGKYSLTELENLDDIEQTRYSEPTKRGLEEFLSKLYFVHTGKELAQKHPDTKIESIFSELKAKDANEVSLDKIGFVRRELDKIIMGEILGLTEEEQVEVYRSIIDLVKARIEKAKSFGNRRKTKEGIDIGAFKNSVMQRIKKESYQ
jgi:hypothetical protein